MILEKRYKSKEKRDVIRESRHKNQDLRFKSKEEKVKSKDFNHHSTQSVSSQTLAPAKVCVSQTLIPRTSQASQLTTHNSTPKTISSYHQSLWLTDLNTQHPTPNTLLSPKSVSHAKVCVSQTLMPKTSQTLKIITKNLKFIIQHYKGALKILASILLFSFLFTP